jgi:hypothetical protein
VYILDLLFLTCIIDVELKKAAKMFANRFACGSSVAKNNQNQDEIVVQGDFSDELLDLILANWPHVSLCGYLEADQLWNGLLTCMWYITRFLRIILTWSKIRRRNKIPLHIRMNMLIHYFKVLYYGVVESIGSFRSKAFFGSEPGKPKNHFMEEENEIKSSCTKHQNRLFNWKESFNPTWTNLFPLSLSIPSSHPL